MTFLVSLAPTIIGIFPLNEPFMAILRDPGSNHKNLELTFAKAESRKELLKLSFESRAGCSPSPSEPMVSVP